MALGVDILSSYGLVSSEPSPVSKMMSEFAKDFRAGFDINLGVGYVNEETIPYEEFAEVVGRIVNKENRPPHLLNYGGPEGSKNLIETIKKFYLELRSAGKIGEVPHFEDKELIIGVSGATSILTGLANVMKKGVVIVTDPVYYIYNSTLERYGFETKPIEEDDFGPKVDVLETVLEGLMKNCVQISFCYFVTVNNPTCTIISNSRRKEIVECVCRLCKKYNKFFPLVFDLAYEWLVHGKCLDKPNSPSIYDEADIVYEVGTFSKIMAPALRIGYIIGPKYSPIVKALVQWNSDVGFSAPLVTQEISAEIIRKYGITQFDKVNRGYMEKSKVFKEKILEELGSSIEELRGGEGGFYLYLTLKGIKTSPSSKFFNLLCIREESKKDKTDINGSRPRLIYIPGIYCVHPKGNLVGKSEYQLRLSYGYEDTNNLIRAVELLKMAIHHTG
ncbi:MAG: aminotransferase class I/II-fold pyridoxal phosphate-dependent enzyme [Candidatus Hydrogenedentes bacterium]|nr:aminotransferase class I/II-fold pyridoxal phosphate-dependent enzyme [Candidatus Hydrogenedentota bacterium]